MFCREQVARFSAIVPELETLGVAVHAVGNGTAPMAQDFVRQFAPPFPVWTDPSREAFKRAGLKRAFGLGVTALKAGRRAMGAGHRQGRTQGDPWQQGGVLLVMPDGRVAFHHVDGAAGDHAHPDPVLAVIRREMSQGTATS